MNNYETFEYDVLVVGTGAAGLRAAIAANDNGVSVGLVCKCLLGKAHTVMAEGGIAAALSNVDYKDDWKTHFKDTMEGGKLLNDWKMARIHAMESPECVLELEKWGAVFDRTEKGYIHQRPFGGHTYRRLCHVGDRTGLELLRTLQDRCVALDINVHMEYLLTDFIKDGSRIIAAVALEKGTGKFVVFKFKAVILATGGLGMIWKVTSNSQDCTADGYALSYFAGAEILNPEFVQFHPTGMVWPLSSKGLLVTEAVRGDGGILRNTKGERFMEKYDPKRMELSTRDIVAKAINREINEGRGTEHGGVYLDISHKPAEYIKKKLPSMYDQFLDLARVDITKGPMEVGPTCHYMMGGVKVDSETQKSRIDNLYAAGEVSGGMHGANRLGGNSLSDLLVFGRRSGMYAAEYSKKARSPHENKDAISASINKVTSMLDKKSGENPFLIHSDLQELMQKNVSIVRNEDGLKAALKALELLKERYKNVVVSGGLKYNPSLDRVITLKFMLKVAEIVTHAALERKETRGAHTREDYPERSDEWGKKNVVVYGENENVKVKQENIEPMPADLAALLNKK